MSITDKISFVLRLQKNDEEIADACIYSVCKLFNNNDIDSFYIITNDDQISYFKEKYIHYGEFIKIINETDVCVNNSMDNWQYEQILTLFIAKNTIKTNYYIILNADCYLTKKLSFSDLFIDGKPIVNSNKKNDTGWLINSCKYFDLDYDNIPDTIIDFSPQILYTQFVNELILSFENIQELIRGQYHEYYLYYCFILKKYGDINKYFYIDINRSLAFNKVVIYRDFLNNNIKETILNQFDNKKTIFDCANCQFVIHYLFSDENTWFNYCENLNCGEFV